MTKKELIAEIAEKTQLTQKDVGTALEGFLSVVKSELKNGGKIQLTGFGNFETKIRAARMGINPKTGQQILIPESRVPTFKAGKAFKEEMK